MFSFRLEAGRACSHGSSRVRGLAHTGASCTSTAGQPGNNLAPCVARSSWETAGAAHSQGSRPPYFTDLLQECEARPARRPGLTPEGPTPGLPLPAGEGSWPGPFMNGHSSDSAWPLPLTLEPLPSPLGNTGLWGLGGTWQVCEWQWWVAHVFLACSKCGSPTMRPQRDWVSCIAGHRCPFAH